MTDINVPRNLHVLDDPGAGDGQSVGGIYIGTDTFVIPMFADQVGQWAYWGPAAGWYLYSSPSTDATLVNQARALAADAKNASLGVDFQNPGDKKWMPYNWATYYVAQNEGKRWVPLAAQGSFIAPVGGQYSSYFGVGPDQPIMVVSAGYDVSVGPVQPGPPELFGWPSVVVSYRRNGSVPPPQGPGQPLDPTSIPGWGPIVASFAAATGAPSLIQAAHDAGVAIPAQGPTYGDVGSQVFIPAAPSGGGMDSVLIGAGAGGVANTPVLSPILTATGGGNPIIPGVAGGGGVFLPVTTAVNTVGGAAGGLLSNLSSGGGLMPILIVGGLLYMLTKKR